MSSPAATPSKDWPASEVDLEAAATPPPPPPRRRCWGRCCLAAFCLAAVLALAIGGSLALCSTSSLAECKLCRGLNYLLLPSGEPASNLPHDASTRILNGVAFPSALTVGDEELWFSGGGDRYEYGLVKVYTAASYLSRDYFHECDPAEASSSPSHLLPIAIPPPHHHHPTSSPSPGTLLRNRRLWRREDDGAAHALPRVDR